MKIYFYHAIAAALWVTLLAVNATGAEATTALSAGSAVEVLRYQRLPDGHIGSLHTVPGSVEPTSRITAEWRNSQALAPVCHDKPLWKFSVAVGLSERTLFALGDIETAVPLVLAQFERLNHRFNDPGVFNGEIQFSVDYVYAFNGSAPLACPQGFDFGVYFEHVLEEDPVMRGSWGLFCGIGCNAVLLAWSPWDGGPFDGWPTDILVHELGHTRGAIDEYSWYVPAENNPVNGAEYPLDPTIMGSTEDAYTWDQHSINLINLAADSVLTSPVNLAALFPDTIGVRVIGSDNVPLTGAQVRLYSVADCGFHVDGIPSQQYSTGDSGWVTLESNPFGPCDPCRSGAEFVNFLVTATLAGKTAFAWMPIDDVQNAYFADSTAPFWLPLKIDDLTDITEPSRPSLPSVAVLGQNYPNPFNLGTRMDYSVSASAHVKIEVYNIAGQKIQTLEDGIKSAGSYHMYWLGTDDAFRPVSSGLYLYRLQAGDYVQTKKMLLLK